MIQIDRKDGGFIRINPTRIEGCWFSPAIVGGALSEEDVFAILMKSGKEFFLERSNFDIDKIQRDLGWYTAYEPATDLC
jgi:hypothetical protein